VHVMADLEHCVLCSSLNFSLQIVSFNFFSLSPSFALFSLLRHMRLFLSFNFSLFQIYGSLSLSGFRSLLSLFCDLLLSLSFARSLSLSLRSSSL